MNDKPLKRNLNGFVLLNKDLHLTSNAALQQVKYLFNAEKAGHTGSLDPLASGMLPLCLGKATKFASFLLEASKEYEVTAMLGAITKSGDAAEEPINIRSIPELTPEKIEAVLQKFRGEISQIPPMYSALKHQGTPLYELARKGIEIDRAARTLHIYALTLLSFTEKTISLRVKCSKGTYIRTLVQDIGEELGCGAYVVALHRTNVAAFENAKMYSLAELTALKQQGLEYLDKTILPIAKVLAFLPEIKLSNLGLLALKNTGSLYVEAHTNTQEEHNFRVLDFANIFKGVAKVQDNCLTIANFL